MTAYTFDQIIDFTRTSAATYVANTGFVTQTPASRNLLTYTQEFDNAAWGKTGSTVVANAVVAPDGTLTADKLVEDSANSPHRVARAVSGSVSVFSIYAKAGERSFVALASGVANEAVWFNLATGAIGTKQSAATGYIENAGNGWYRCSIVSTAPTNVQIYVSNADGVDTYTGNGTSGIYIWGAQLEAVPDANLVLGSAIISPEAGPYGSLPSGIAGQGSPQTTSVVSGAVRTEVTGTVTATVRAEASFACVSGRTYRIAYTLNSNAGIELTGFANLTPNTQPTLASGSRTGVFYVTATATGTAIIRFYPRTSTSASQQTGDFVEINAMSIREITGTTGMPTTYTRNVGGVYPPRFDYDPVTLAPRGLLIEEQRTNLLLRSEEFDNAAWTKTRSSITANAIAAPDGTTTADKLVEDTTASSTHAAQSAIITFTATSYTGFVYLKAAERTWALVRVGSSGANVNAYFDLANGVVGTVGASATASITAVGNGWYKCTVSGTAAAGADYGVSVFTATGNNVATYTGDGTSGIYLWGAQLEAGAFATSYIPTVASQVTRTSDQAAVTGANFSRWYNGSEGTFVVEADSVVPTSAISANAPFGINAGASTNQLRVFVYNGRWGGSVNANGVTQADLLIAGTYTPNVAAKFGFAYKENDFAFSAIGAAALTDTAGTVPSNLNQASLGSGPNSPINGHIRRIRYYPTRLSNTQLQALTA